MMLPVCSHEKEVLEALRGGHWPAGCAPELRDHVAACRVCSNLVLVTTTFRAAKAVSVQAATLNSPGLLWWRAQLRRRNAAIERVAKPFLGAQLFALGVYLLVAAGFVLSEVHNLQRWQDWFTELSQAKAFHLEVLLPAANEAGNHLWALTTVLPAIALLGLVGGVLVYCAIDKP